MKSRGARGVSVHVWGDLACFTDPLSKVERVSYPVPTPSAARGILEAIFWEPEMYYEVRSVIILKPLRWLNITRNELKSKTSYVVARRRAAGGEGYFHEDDITQRNVMTLADVAYIIDAEIYVQPDLREKQNAVKYISQFERRVSKGQCFRQPCLGLREFAAFFAPVPEEQPEPCNISINCGFMLGEMEYLGPKSTIANPRIMQAEIVNGVMKVPREVYEGRRNRGKRQ